MRTSLRIHVEVVCGVRWIWVDGGVRMNEREGGVYYLASGLAAGGGFESGRERLERKLSGDDIGHWSLDVDADGGWRVVPAPCLRARCGEDWERGLRCLSRSLVAVGAFAWRSLCLEVTMPSAVGCLL